MNFGNYIKCVETSVIRNHSEVMIWFEENTALKNYSPRNSGWSILENLEHIGLTSHFLLLLIEKGTRKALRKKESVDLKSTIESFDSNFEKLYDIGINQSLEWNRPEHMVPTGSKSELEIKTQLLDQERACLEFLNQLKHGEGILQLTTMTVNNLGKLNVYEYIYFLSMHIGRHVEQMQGVKAEWLTIRN